MSNKTPVMKNLKPILMSGKEVYPLIEGGKGISISTGKSSGPWAKAGGIGTISGVNADSFDENGNLLPQIYHGKTRKERHHELVQFGIQGGINQARIAHDIAGNEGRLHVNILWEMGGAEQILRGILEGAKGLIHGVTCGAGMPYKLSEIAAEHKIYYYPIVSSARAFNALWKRSYHKSKEFLGAVVYEDPWLAGGHNGLSNSEDPTKPEDPYPRIVEMRKLLNSIGLETTPIIMAGGVWHLKDWAHWLDNPEVGPIGFQFGTRPLLTQESPISMAWKKRLLTLNEGDVFLNRFSPTGFYSSAVNNQFIRELRGRSERQIPFSSVPVGDMQVELPFGPRKRTLYVSMDSKQLADSFITAGYDEMLKTPDNTLIFVQKQKADEIISDQINCMGCLSSCRFSNWAQTEEGSNGKKADPRSFCIQKTLQNISHTANPEQLENELMFSGHNAFKFKADPYYANGFIPTVQQLFERILTGE